MRLYFSVPRKTLSEWHGIPVAEVRCVCFATEACHIRPQELQQECLWYYRFSLSNMRIVLPAFCCFFLLHTPSPISPNAGLVWLAKTLYSRNFVHSNQYVAPDIPSILFPLSLYLVLRKAHVSP